MREIFLRETVFHKGKEEHTPVTGVGSRCQVQLPVLSC